jgi:hypothetical protein
LERLIHNEGFLYTLFFQGKRRWLCNYLRSN